MSVNCIETLEARLAMSVSGYSLANFNTGTILTWHTTANQQTTADVTYTVLGPKTVRHVPVIQTESVSTSTSGTSTSVNDIIASPTEGQLLYRSDEVNKQGSGVTRTSEAFSSPKSLTLFPRKLAAGTKYTYNVTLNQTAVASDGTPSSATYAETFSVTLRSDKSRRVTAAGHTWHCYVIDEVTSFTSGGQTQTTATTEYIAPGVGVISSSSVAVSSTAPHHKDYSTMELASYNLA